MRGITIFLTIIFLFSTILQGNIIIAENNPISPSFSEPSDYLDLIWSKGFGVQLGNYNSFLVEDIDGDGKQELIFGNANPYVHILQFINGTYSIEWRSERFLYGNLRGIIMDDVDSNGYKDFIVCSPYDYLYVFNGSDNILQQEYFEKNSNFKYFAMGDIDDDGIKEIVIVEAGGNLIIIEGDDFIKEWESTNEYEGFSPNSDKWALKVTDVDEDNIPDIVMGISKSYVIVDGRNFTTKRENRNIDPNMNNFEIGKIHPNDYPSITLVNNEHIQIYNAFNDSLMCDYSIEGKWMYTGKIIKMGNVDNDDDTEIIISNYTNFIVFDGSNNIIEGISDDFQSEITGIATGDIDNDGEIEIVVGTYNGSIKIVNGNTLEIEWEYNATHINPQALFVFDIDNDGFQEILGGSEEGVMYIYNGTDYSLKFEKKLIEYEINGLIMDDSKGIGNLRMILWSNNHFYIFSMDTYDLIFKSPDLKSKIYDISMDDINNNGTSDIIIVTDSDIINSNVGIYSFNGLTYEQDWFLGDFGRGFRKLITGDIDKDGSKEILVNDKNGFIYLIDGNTKNIDWTSENNVNYSKNVAIGDVNNDGYNELIICNSKGRIYIINSINFKIEWEGELEFLNSIHAVYVFDIDNDEDAEIIFFKHDYFYILDGKTKNLEWQSKRMDYSIGFYDTYFSDLNGDNQIEIVTGENNYCYVFSVRNKPDLSIENLYYSNKEPFEGDEIKITVSIKNKGKSDASGVPILLMIDNKTITTQNISLSANSIKEVTFKWVASSGSHNVTIKLDPNNQIKEGDEFDNTENSEIFVHKSESIINTIIVILGIFAVITGSLILINLRRKKKD